jgi:hypothetical protein
MEILEQRLRCRTSGTSAYSHTYGDYDDSRIPNPAKIAEVVDVGQGSGNSTAQRRATMVRSLSYIALREATREGERGGGGRRPSGGGGRQPREEGLMELCCALLSWAPSLCRGGGVHPCPIPKPQGRQPRGREGWQRLGWGRPSWPQNPNPGRPWPGPKASPPSFP